MNGVDLNGGGNVEAGLLESEAQSARACKQIDSDRPLTHCPRVRALPLPTAGNRRYRQLSRSTHEILQPSRQSVGIDKLALPNHKRSPSERFKALHLFSITINVSFKLRLPVIKPRFRESALRAPMQMPEAAVHEDRLPSAYEHNIRFPGKIVAVQPIAVPHGVEAPPDEHFRFRIPALDSLHDTASLFTSARVHVLVWCLTNTLTHLRVLLAVGCVRHPGLDPGSSSRGARHGGATAGRPYRSSRLADDQNALASS